MSRFPIFSIPSTVLDALLLTTPTESDAIDFTVNSVVSIPSHSLTCTTCDMHSVPRTHYKSDLHFHNLRLASLSLPPLTSDAFEDLLERGSLASIDNSDSDSDSDDDLTIKPAHRTPMILFALSNGKSLKTYKAALVQQTPQYMLSLRQPLAQERTWVMVMLASGHFAAAVYSLVTGKCIDNKSFHRYTTRKKQGGAQSALDNSKGKAKSAGAGLRRHNEYALQIEVKELMTSWRSYFSQAELVFIRMPQKNKKNLLFDGIVAEDKIRGFPLTTKRPTFNELGRCFSVLSTCEVIDTPQEIVVERVEKVEKVKIIKEKEVVVRVEVDLVMEKAVDLLRKSKLDLFMSHLEKHAISLTASFDPSLGFSFLHIAAQFSNATVIENLLERGVSPELRNPNNKTPYELCIERDSRDVFRIFMASYPDRYDWPKTAIPSALTEDMIKKRKEKERGKSDKHEAGFKKREVQQVEIVQEAVPEKKKVTRFNATQLSTMRMDPAVRMRLDREKRATAAEARMRSTLNMCSACGRSLDGIVPFDKYQFRYCSTECVGEHAILGDW